MSIILFSVLRDLCKMKHRHIVLSGSYYQYLHATISLANHQKPMPKTDFRFSREFFGVLGSFFLSKMSFQHLAEIFQISNPLSLNLWYKTISSDPYNLLIQQKLLRIHIFIVMIVPEEPLLKLHCLTDLLQILCQNIRLIQSTSQQHLCTG